MILFCNHNDGLHDDIDTVDAHDIIRNPVAILMMTNSEVT